jgi:hypothetical protein
MAKKNLFQKPQGILTAMAGPSMTPGKMPPEPKEIRIREADGGFIVSHGFSEPGKKDKVYHSLDELKGCLDETFGGTKSAKEGSAKEEKGESKAESKSEGDEKKGKAY